MKRDLKLIKEILIEIEKKNTIKSAELKLKTKSKRDEIYYHLKILQQAGLIDGRELTDKSGPLFIPSYLTWEGQEYLTYLRNNKFWNLIKEKGSLLSFALIKSLALKYIQP